MSGLANISQTDAPPRRVILHCGVQKTGSTSLHRFLTRNAKALKGRLEVRPPQRKTPQQELGRAATRFSLDPSDATGDDLVTAIGALRDKVLEGGSEPCLVSHENICGAVPGRAGRTRLYPYFPAIARLIVAHMAPLRPEFVLYTRDLDTWRPSVYAQMVHSDWYTKTMQEFMDDTDDLGDWDGLKASVSKGLGVGKLTMFRLEDEGEPDFPGSQLLRHCGLSDAEIHALRPHTRKSNQRLNAGALEFIRQINALELAPRTRTDVVELAVRNQALFNSNSTPSGHA